MVKNVTQSKIGIAINVNMTVTVQKSIMCVEQTIFEILAHGLENDKYIGSIIGDSGITCDEIVQATKIIQIKIFRQMLKNKM